MKNLNFFFQGFERSFAHGSSFVSKLVLVVSLFGSAQCLADTDGFSFANTFNPSNDGFYRSYTTVNSLTGIETEALLTSADELLNPANYGQRNLNYQWLEMYSTGNYKKLRMGSKASAKLLKIGLMAYWQKIKGKNFKNASYLPDADGKGILFNLDYKVKVSDKKFKFRVKYDF